MYDNVELKKVDNIENLVEDLSKVIYEELINMEWPETGEIIEHILDLNIKVTMQDIKGKKSATVAVIIDSNKSNGMYH